ncbi:hypothetical protein [Stenotrophomonas rhizophila]
MRRQFGRQRRDHCRALLACGGVCGDADPAGALGAENAPDIRESVSIDPNAAEWIAPALQRYVGAGMASAAISASRRSTVMPASAAQVGLSKK